MPQGKECHLRTVLAGLARTLHAPRNQASAPENAHVPALSHIPAPQDGVPAALFPGMGPAARGRRRGGLCPSAQAVSGASTLRIMERGEMVLFIAIALACWRSRSPCSSAACTICSWLRPRRISRSRSPGWSTGCCTSGQSLVVRFPRFRSLHDRPSPNKPSRSAFAPGAWAASSMLPLAPGRSARGADPHDRWLTGDIGWRRIGWGRSVGCVRLEGHMAAQPSWADRAAPRADPADRRPSRRTGASQVCTARNVCCRCRCRDRFVQPGWA